VPKRGLKGSRQQHITQPVPLFACIARTATTIRVRRPSRTERGRGEQLASGSHGSHSQVIGEAQPVIFRHQQLDALVVKPNLGRIGSVHVRGEETTR
jgi:hypothetical protein